MLESKINLEHKKYFKSKNINYLFLEYGTVVAFIIIIAVATILYPRFLLPENLLNIYSQLSIIGVMSIGMTFVLITGGLDMSVGGIYAASAVLVASLADHLPLAVVIVITILFGFILGLLNGVIVTKFNVPAFIATLGSGSIFTGMALLYSDSQPFYVEKTSFQWLGSGFVGVIPASVIFLFLAYFIAGIILTFTTFGKSLFSIGGNKEASRLSGLRVNGITTSVYGISGMCAALSGIIIASRLGQGQANIGETIVLDVIAAVVIGGTSLYGGQGAIWRTFIGGSTLIILSNVFDSMAMSPYWQSTFKGIIIIGAVMFDFYTRSKLNK
ncbi:MULTISPECIES: ABC transporter permease [Bacillaceae]|uniref:ABC transporter permease n=1 Tax=Bacillaceae TaxID=186817 RepID=UPI00118B4412|nr:ABC transporter permease [Bacillus sp. S3]QCJ42895.1 ABC transporter permease [Bacillus sp. S3]